MAIPWLDWASLGKPPGADLGEPVAQRNSDGGLQAFAIGKGEVFTLSQVLSGGDSIWQDHWVSLGRPSPEVGVQTHVVGRNADGRLEIFAVGDDFALWRRQQSAPGYDWSEWQSLDRPAPDASLTHQLTVGSNQDGRLEVFAVAGDGNVWHVWQTSPNGGFGSWEALGRPVVGIRSTDRISVVNNEDRRQELFLIGMDGALWHIWQLAPNSGWGNWDSLGKPRDLFGGLEPPKNRDLFEPIAQRNADGHLEMFVPGNGAFCNRWQERWRDGESKIYWRRRGWNAKAKPRPNLELTNHVDAGLNFENRLEFMGFAEDGDLWRSWQIDTSPFWSDWESLGSPEPGIRPLEGLAIAMNEDGRLEAFVVGQDGGMWHIDQGTTGTGSGI
jgi:hypothetical protein